MSFFSRLELRRTKSQGNRCFVLRAIVEMQAIAAPVQPLVFQPLKEMFTRFFLAEQKHGKTLEKHIFFTHKLTKKNMKHIGKNNRTVFLDKFVTNFLSAFSRNVSVLNLEVVAANPKKNPIIRWLPCFKLINLRPSKYS